VPVLVAYNKQLLFLFKQQPFTNLIYDHNWSCMTRLFAGGDGGQIFNTKMHSSTIIGIRCPDCPSHLTATSKAWKVLLVIEGPHEPATLRHVLQPTVDFFANHDAGRAGSEAYTVYDAHAERQVAHWPVLAYVEGDTPFMSKLSEGVGHTAMRACQRCSLWGISDSGSGTVRYARKDEMKCLSLR
jgi:hypothetical protein